MVHVCTCKSVFLPRRRRKQDTDDITYRSVWPGGPGRRQETPNATVCSRRPGGAGQQSRRTASGTSPARRRGNRTQQKYLPALPRRSSPGRGRRAPSATVCTLRHGRRRARPAGQGNTTPGSNFREGLGPEGRPKTGHSESDSLHLHAPRSGRGTGGPVGNSSRRARPAGEESKTPTKTNACAARVRRTGRRQGTPRVTVCTCTPGGRGEEQEGRRATALAEPGPPAKRARHQQK